MRSHGSGRLKEKVVADSRAYNARVRQDAERRKRWASDKSQAQSAAELIARGQAEPIERAPEPAEQPAPAEPEAEPDAPAATPQKEPPQAAEPQAEPAEETTPEPQADTVGFDVGAMMLVESRLKEGLPVTPELKRQYDRWKPPHEIETELVPCAAIEPEPQLSAV